MTKPGVGASQAGSRLLKESQFSVLDGGKVCQAMAKEKVEAVLARDAAPQKLVDPAKSYRVSIQLGASQRWREYQPGAWKRNHAAEVNEGDRAYLHQPSIYENIGPFSGEIVNGLITQHNMWVKANKSQTVGGHVQRQLLVIDVQETDETAPGRGLAGGGFSEMIRVAIREAVRESVKAVLQETRAASK